MIQVMTLSALAVCVNCNHLIKRGRGDMETTERWWHEENGLETCPGSPVATPNPASVKVADQPEAPQ